MIEFAESEFELNAVQDGKSKRDHYETAWQLTGVKPKELEQPPLDPMVIPVWLKFSELHRCRGSTGFGPAAITYRDIADWSNVTGSNLKSWEIAAILAVDNVYLREVQKQTK